MKECGAPEAVKPERAIRGGGARLSLLGLYLFIYFFFFGYFCRSLSAEVKSTGEALAISILCVYVGDLMLGGWSLIIRLRLDAYKSIKRSDELRESSSSVRIPQKR